MFDYMGTDPLTKETVLGREQKRTAAILLSQKIQVILKTNVSIFCPSAMHH